MTGQRQPNRGGLSKGLLAGLSWTASAQVGVQVVTFAAGVVLARILAPSDFGVLSMALAYTTFLWLLGQAGFNSAIVFHDDVSDLDLCTMYWANFGLNMLLFAVAAAGAPLAAAFFHTSSLTSVVWVSSLSLVVSALGGVQRTLLEKRLQFSLLARNQLFAAVVYAASAVVMAWAGMGVWALVISTVLRDVADGALAAVQARWLPRLAFGRESFGRLLSYGSKVWAGNVLFYGQENIDKLVVGRMLGPMGLGFYSQAFRLGNFPRYFYVGIVTRVMFPSLSSSRDEPGTAKRTFLEFNGFSILVAGGLCLGLALVAPEFISVVLGEKWMPSVPLLEVLAIAAAVYSASHLCAPVLQAMGRPGDWTRSVLGSSAVLLIGSIAGAHFLGAIGVSYSVLISATVSFVLAQRAVVRVLDVRAGEYFGSVAPALTAVAAMAGVVVAWRWVGGNVLAVGTAVWLVAAIVLGGVALVVSFGLMRPEARAMLKRKNGSAVVDAAIGPRSAEIDLEDAS